MFFFLNFVCNFESSQNEELEISCQRYSNKVLFQLQLQLQCCACISYFETFYYIVSTRWQPRTFPLQEIICPAHLLDAVHREAVQLSMQRLARLYIVTITSFQVFTTTRRHRTHLYLFSRLASCIRMHVLRYATLYPHFDFAPRSGIGNVKIGEPLLRYNVGSTYR